MSMQMTKDRGQQDLYLAVGAFSPQNSVAKLFFFSWTNDYVIRDSEESHQSMGFIQQKSFVSERNNTCMGKNGFVNKIVQL